MKPVVTIAEQVETVFRRIHETRMRDIPILNAALWVETVGFRIHEDHWLGALITPWSINLMLLPAASAEGTARTSGTIRTVTFPAGDFEFIAAHEPGIGAYEMCSLYSPVTELADQATAVATARMALDLLLDERMAEIDEATLHAANPQPSRGITRRELLRGRLRGPSA